MDTRQLRAFCEVVERKSFSQAAERLGRHPAGRQPAGARAREAARPAAPRPLGPAGRADRGGPSPLPRRAAPARARGGDHERARRRGDRRARRARSRSAPRPGPAASSSPSCSASSPRVHPQLHVALSVFDTQTVVDRVADRTLELGVVGAAPRHRARRVRAVLPRHGDPRLPARPSVRRPDGDARGAEGRAADRDAGRRRASGR